MIPTPETRQLLYIRLMKHRFSLMLLASMLSSITWAQSRQTSLSFNVVPNSAYAFEHPNSAPEATTVSSSLLYEISVQTTKYIDGYRTHWNWSSFQLAYGFNSANINQVAGYPSPEYGFVRRFETLTSTSSNLISAFYKPSYKRAFIRESKHQWSWFTSAILGSRYRFQHNETYRSLSDQSESRKVSDIAETVSFIAGLEPGVEFQWNINRATKGTVALSYPIYGERIFSTDGSQYSTSAFQPSFGQLSLGLIF